MTRDEVRAAGRRVVRWHQRFGGLFGRTGPQRHGMTYLKGLLSDEPRKSMEPIAFRFARSPDGGPATQKEVVALEEFMRCSPWEAGDVLREVQAVVAEELLPAAMECPIGTVGVIDESGFIKAGRESVGVAVQWCGRAGKTANCQVGVFLVVVTPAGTACLGSP